MRSVSPPAKINTTFEPLVPGRQEVVILGSAGQRIITAGEVLCLAGLTAGLRVAQKNEYDITVLRGPSISELILSPEEIGYTGIGRPNVILALSQEGVDRKESLFDDIDANTLIIRVQGIDVPRCNGKIHGMDVKAWGIKAHDWALAALAVMAKLNSVVSLEMLRSALAFKFKGKVLLSALNLIDRAETGF